METTFQSLHHVNPVYACQCLADMDSITIFCTQFWFQELNSTITGVVQMRLKLVVRQHIQRIEETIAGVYIHFIFQWSRSQGLWKDNSLCFQILLIFRVVFDVASCPADSNFVYDSLTDYFVNLVHVSCNITRFTLFH